MPKIRLTKTELKKQKEDLKRFSRYLPMLVLKKRQLQLEIIKVHQQIKELAKLSDDLRNNLMPWIDVFAEDVGMDELCKLENIRTGEGNVAGIYLPIFVEATFQEKEYDLLTTPLWVDKGIVALKDMLTLKAKLVIFHKQIEILKEELRISTQRVNLFEKVKIPEAQENIRMIQIFLGELRTAEVVRGKIAKNKLERRKLVLENA